MSASTQTGVPSEWVGKVVLVTGASSGIGRGTALEFARRGVSVIAVARRLNLLEELKQECMAIGLRQNQVHLIQADLSKMEEVEKVVSRTRECSDRLDFVVANAGITGPAGEMVDMAEDMFDKIMNVNVKSVWILLKGLVPELIKTKGAVVTVSSTCGTPRVLPGLGVYSMSKAALDQMMRFFAAEFAGVGVRFNSVNPAVIETPIFTLAFQSEKKAEGFLQHAGQDHGIGRIGQVGDVAEPIVFLCSHAARFITGQTHVLDGAAMLPINYVHGMAHATE